MQPVSRIDGGGGQFLPGEGLGLARLPAATAQGRRGL